MTSLLPSEVLSRAADLIEKPGAWTQRRYGSPGRPMCAVGALRAASHDGPYTAPYNYLARYVDSAAVSIWNDAPERTQSEVVSVLRAASELARREGK